MFVCFNVTEACPQSKSLRASHACNTDATEYAVCVTQTNSPVYRNRACAKCNSADCVALPLPPYYRDILQNTASVIPPTLFKVNFNYTHEEPTRTQRYGVIIGCTLSIVALLLLLCFFASSQSRRTFSSLLICTMAACMAALFGLTIAINYHTSATADNALLCRELARLLHAFYLLTFSWTAMLSIDMMHKFKSLSTSHNDKRRYAVYFLITSIFTGVIVLAAFVMDTFASGSPMAPRYGVDLCWISNPYARVCWFVVPIAGVIAFNLIAVLYLARLLMLSNAIHRSSAANSGRGTSLAVLKITVVLGVPWLATLVSAYAATPLLETITTTVNCLQGVFLALCFVCNQKNRRTISAKFRGRNGRDVIALTIRVDVGGQ